MYAHNGQAQWSILRRTWPSTKGGLAVVRPRRASSIRQTTLVSHGRVQDGEQETKSLETKRAFVEVLLGILLEILVLASKKP